MPLSLASPAWLLGLIATAIPIALHLWSRRPSQLVRLGSLDHLRGAPGPRAWGRQLDDLALLAIRFAVLAACVLGLAGLRWHGEGSGPSDPTELVVADPELVADSLAFFSDPVVDSLRRAQVPIHLLEAGLPILGAGGSPASETGGASIWSLLQEWDVSAPAGSSVMVIAQARAGRLGAGRPSLASRLRWHAPAIAADGGHVADSWPGGVDSLVRVIEEVEATRHHRGFEYLPATAGGSLGSQQGRGATLLGGGHLNNRSVIFRSVQIVTGQSDTELAPTFHAASAAVLLGSQGFVPPISVATPEGWAPATSESELQIWLNVQSISSADPTSGNSWIIEFVPSQAASGSSSREGGPARGGLNESYPNWASPLPEESPGAPFLVDPAGRAWATVAATESGRWYRVGVDSARAGSMRGDPALPRLLHAIVAGGSPALTAPVSTPQATPLGRPAEPVQASAGSSLTRPLLILAGLLLALERLLARSRRQAGP